MLSQGSSAISRPSNVEEIDSCAKLSRSFALLVGYSDPVLSGGITSDVPAVGDELCRRCDIGIGRARRGLRLSAAA